MNANLSITKGIKKEKVKVIFLEDTVRKAKGKRMYHRDKKKKKKSNGNHKLLQKSNGK